MIRNVSILVGFRLAAVVVVACCLVSACGTQRYIDVVNHDAGQGGSAGGAGGAGGADADGGPTTGGGDSGCVLGCEGDCVALPPLEFSDPLLAWIGDESEQANAPPCPDNAPVLQFEGHGDPSIPAASCSPCSCGPSTGSCALPTAIVANAAICDFAEGAASIPSNPPASWDGSCNAENVIPAGASCAGKPCVQAITIDAMPLTDDACVATGTSTAPLEAPTFGKFARVCEGITSTGFAGCGNPGELCVPAQSAGYRQCVEQAGIHECPIDGYSDQFIVYEDFADQRACSACACGAPQGSNCSAYISIFPDNGCTGQPLTVSVSSEKETCLDVNPSGKAIAGKTATEPLYQPGICKTSGGELVGDVLFLGARTLCCLP